MATRKQRTVGSRAVEDGLSLLAGAGIGMALMYLLDPEQGRDRRYRIRRAAGEALESAGATMSSSLGAATGSASSLGSRLRDRVSGAYDSASDYASDGASNASGFFGRAYDRARSAVSNAFHRASDAGANAADYAASYVPHIETEADRRRHFWGQMLCAVGSLGLGAGIVYFVDPAQGRTRRAKARDKFFSVTNQTGDFFSRTGRHLRNKFHGYYAEGKSAAMNAVGAGEETDDRALSERIRARLGHFVSNPRSINVQCTSGRVTLTGTAADAELSEIISTVSGIRGVTSVDNRLTSGSGAGEPTRTAQGA